MLHIASEVGGLCIRNKYFEIFYCKFVLVGLSWTQKPPRTVPYVQIPRSQIPLRAALVARIRGDAAPTGSGKWAKTKRYRTRKQSRLRLRKDNRSAQQRLSACGNGEGRVVKDPHMIWSWSKPGIFFLAGAPAPGRQGGQGQCGGPGLPNGAVGDYG